VYTPSRISNNALSVECPFR